MIVDDPTRQAIEAFFHINLQGLSIIIAIIVSAYKIIKLLRKFDRGFDLWLWEHKVMWSHWQRFNRMPTYPKIDTDERHYNQQQQHPEKENK